MNHLIDCTLLMTIAVTEGDSIPSLIKLVTARIGAAVDSRYFAPNFKANLDFLEGQLATSPGDGQYLCGTQLTTADILMSFPILVLRGDKNRGLTESNYPRLWAYCNLLENNEIYKRSIQKTEAATGEKYSLV